MQTEDNSLSGWFQGRIEKIHSAPKESDLHTEFQDLFTDHPHIVLNHKPVSISDLHAHFANRRFAAVGETVDWKHVVEDKVEEEEEEEGKGEKKEETASTETVAGSYVVTRSLKFRIRAAPAQRKSHVVFSAKVKKQLAEGRKIFELYLTMVDKAVPVSLPQFQ